MLIFLRMERVVKGLVENVFFQVKIFYIWGENKAIYVDNYAPSKINPVHAFVDMSKKLRLNLFQLDLQCTFIKLIWNIFFQLL